MKTQTPLILALLLFIGLPSMAQTKVACIGNSITYGAGIVNREKNCYPAQLQEYLGDEYQVANFGVSACTLLSRGNYPYITTDVYKNSLAFNPDIVLIKLGTNDSKPYNIKYKEELKRDYQLLIDSYKSLPSHPRIVLISPIRCFLTDSEIDNTIIQREVVPIIRELALENNLELIDLYRIFGEQIDTALLPDYLHPSSIGAGLMSRYIYNYLQVEARPIQNNQSIPQFNFYGYKGYDFEHGGVSCKIVEPKRVARGKPWVLRARFWGHEPQFDIALLEQGYHIAYCDVADLYGSVTAIKRWNAFYKLMITEGFNSKVVLEGMSRGGLIIYNWAAVNPEKVACIYADAPVLDLNSWPLGQGSSLGSTVDSANVVSLKAKFSKKGVSSPLDHVGKLAKAKIPILHVVGEADSIVPVAENTALFESELHKLGHQITVIRKAGVGHHPHSLFNPQPIVDFVLKATGNKVNYCTLPVPGNEFRSGAAWAEGAEWHSVAQDIESSLSNKELDVLFLGNSITQGMGGSRILVTHTPGKQAMNEALGEGCWEAAGISGDKVENLIWRIQNSDYSSCQAKNIVITIGINNMYSNNDSPTDVVEGIKLLVADVERRFTQSNILLLGAFPVAQLATDKKRMAVDELHRLLGNRSWGKTKYINPTSWFTHSNGDLRSELYSEDLLHLSEKGYSEWANQIKKYIIIKKL